MAIIGCLGDIAFTVSASTMRVLNNFQWSGTAKYAVHQRHLGRGLVEFTGVDPDQISFDITLLAQLGVEPIREIEKIQKYKEQGKTLPLTLGTKVYGKYRWVITGHTVKAQHFDRRGDLFMATLSIKLQEYLRK